MADKGSSEDTSMSSFITSLEEEGDQLGWGGGSMENFWGEFWGLWAAMC